MKAAASDFALYRQNRGTGPAADRNHRRTMVSSGRVYRGRTRRFFDGGFMRADFKK